MTFLYGKSGIIGIKYDRSKFLFRKNAYGDVTEVYNVSGVLVAKYSYSAYGECTIEYNKDNAAHINPIRYRGYYYDEETGLYYLNSRYYDPETGRFLNADDISYIDPETINGLNLYAYCGNNPVMRIDENGNAWWHWLLGGGALIVVAAATVLTLGAAGIAVGGLAGAVIHGAAVGALIGAGVGAVGGAIAGGIYSAVTGADFWTSVGIGVAAGFGIGAIIGAVIGGTVGGLQYGTFGSKAALNSQLYKTWY